MTPEQFKVILKALINYGCEPTVLINEKLNVPVVKGAEGFTFLKRKIKGIIVFREGFPFDKMDIKVEDFVQAMDVIRGTILKSQGKYFRPENEVDYRRHYWKANGVCVGAPDEPEYAMAAGQEI